MNGGIPDLFAGSRPDFLRNFPKIAARGNLLRGTPPRRILSAGIHKVQERQLKDADFGGTIWPAALWLSKGHHRRITAFGGSSWLLPSARGLSGTTSIFSAASPLFFLRNFIRPA